ncbi:unnamed protein product [Rhizophagus irregularis]|nr:unnamed protein product [Rhizophagus irregularis]CAB4433747.1 unnamed protein product [Rhizophagus irregularis]
MGYRPTVACVISGKLYLAVVNEHKKYLVHRFFNGLRRNHTFCFGKKDNYTKMIVKFLKFSINEYYKSNELG